MIDGIDHVEIEASDGEAMADFLKLLGYEEVRRTDHHGLSIELAPPAGSDGPLFEVHTASGEEVPGVNHVAFSTQDIDATYESLEEADVAELVEPHLVEKTGRTVANLRDPDGRRFQLVEDG